MKREGVTPRKSLRAVRHLIKSRETWIPWMIPGIILHGLPGLIIGHICIQTDPEKAGPGPGNMPRITFTLDKILKPQGIGFILKTTYDHLVILPEGYSFLQFLDWRLHDR